MSPELSNLDEDDEVIVEQLVGDTTLRPTLKARPPVFPRVRQQNIFPRFPVLGKAITNKILK